MVKLKKNKHIYTYVYTKVSKLTINIIFKSLIIDSV